MKKGFTLIELITVVIIIGILAMIAIPQFFKVAERGRASEATAALGAYRSAQLRYATEHATTTNTVNDLDVETTTLKFFSGPVLYAVGNPRSNPNSNIVSATRNNVSNSGYGNYVLYIQVDGDITCAGGSGNICQALGY